uniref:subtilisin n=1 Tax=Chromera velia CCMP2878 TaxID=1169474 RepID=A0A0G4G7F7_9ALVE|eukprot:Cvel_4287.t1-p1 / transcript=Cvel_4287.t1 / gene=Cvel_4287 / organism=Chromera_velia_CCMP2878 / gene_product=Thermitase, putative / transcript_product=Thermitase, putative / location=Cvel_scaffold186:12107-27753(+) / protein_length=3484 / sequence_SO=supercontig / SO=protein_coding / is_pseudo=false
MLLLCVCVFALFSAPTRTTVADSSPLIDGSRLLFALREEFTEDEEERRSVLERITSETEGVQRIESLQILGIEIAHLDSHIEAEDVLHKLERVPEVEAVQLNYRHPPVEGSEETGSASSSPSGRRRLERGGRRLAEEEAPVSSARREGEGVSSSTSSSRHPWRSPLLRPEPQTEGEGGVGGQSEVLPNDSFLVDRGMWWVRAVDAPSAWRLHRGDKGILIAVIDSGVDVNHPDLRENIWRNEEEVVGDGIDNDGNGYVDDVYGYNFLDEIPDPSAQSVHGTHVAGLLGAKGNNSEGVVGVNWAPRLMALKVMDATGGRDDAYARAWEYAGRMGARVSTASFGWKSGPFFVRTVLHRILKSLGAIGHLVFASAGNDGTDNDAFEASGRLVSCSFPCGFQLPNVVCVQSSDPGGGLSGFSNVGKRSVEVAAPGFEVLSTFGFDWYSEMSGTSFAAPIAGGIAALVWSWLPELSWMQVRDAVLSSAVQSPRLTALSATGAVVNARRALEAGVRSLAAGCDRLHVQIAELGGIVDGHTEEVEEGGEHPPPVSLSGVWKGVLPARILLGTVEEGGVVSPCVWTLEGFSQGGGRAVLIASASLSAWLIVTEGERRFFLSAVNGDARLEGGSPPDFSSSVREVEGGSGQVASLLYQSGVSRRPPGGVWFECEGVGNFTLSDEMIRLGLSGSSDTFPSFSSFPSLSMPIPLFLSEKEAELLGERERALARQTRGARVVRKWNVQTACRGKGSCDFSSDTCGFSGLLPEYLGSLGDPRVTRQQQSLQQRSTSRFSSEADEEDEDVLVIGWKWRRRVNFAESMALTLPQFRRDNRRGGANGPGSVPAAIGPHRDRTFRTWGGFALLDLTPTLPLLPRGNQNQNPLRGLPLNGSPPTTRSHRITPMFSHPVMTTGVHCVKFFLDAKLFGFFRLFMVVREPLASLSDINNQQAEESTTNFNKSSSSAWREKRIPIFFEYSDFWEGLQFEISPEIPGWQLGFHMEVGAHNNTAQPDDARVVSRRRYVTRSFSPRQNEREVAFSVRDVFAAIDDIGIAPGRCEGGLPQFQPSGSSSAIREACTWLRVDGLRGEGSPLGLRHSGNFWVYVGSVNGKPLYASKYLLIYWDDRTHKWTLGYWRSSGHEFMAAIEHCMGRADCDLEATRRARAGRGGERGGQAPAFLLDRAVVIARAVATSEEESMLPPYQSEWEMDGDGFGGLEGDEREKVMREMETDGVLMWGDTADSLPFVQIACESDNRLVTPSFIREPSVRCDFEYGGCGWNFAAYNWTNTSAVTGVSDESTPVISPPLQQEERERDAGCEGPKGPAMGWSLEMAGARLNSFADQIVSDHSPSQSSVLYAFVDTSFWLPKGAVARMESPAQSLPVQQQRSRDGREMETAKLCVEWYYRIFGRTVGDLRVMVVEDKKPLPHFEDVLINPGRCPELAPGPDGLVKALWLFSEEDGESSTDWKVGRLSVEFVREKLREGGEGAETSKLNLTAGIGESGMRRNATFSSSTSSSFSVPLSSSSFGFKLAFEAVCSGDIDGSVAVDDINFYEGSCPEPSCGFDGSLCSLSNDREVVTQRGSTWELGPQQSRLELLGLPSSGHVAGLSSIFSSSLFGTTRTAASGGRQQDLSAFLRRGRSIGGTLRSGLVVAPGAHSLVESILDREQVLFNPGPLPSPSPRVRARLGGGLGAGGGGHRRLQEQVEKGGKRVRRPVRRKLLESLLYAHQFVVRPHDTVASSADFTAQLSPLPANGYMWTLLDSPLERSTIFSKDIAPPSLRERRQREKNLRQQMKAAERDYPQAVSTMKGDLSSSSSSWFAHLGFESRVLSSSSPPSSSSFSHFSSFGFETASFDMGAGSLSTQASLQGGGGGLSLPSVAETPYCLSFWYMPSLKFLGDLSEVMRNSRTTTETEGAGGTGGGVQRGGGPGGDVHVHLRAILNEGGKRRLLWRSSGLETGDAWELAQVKFAASQHFNVSLTAEASLGLEKGSEVATVAVDKFSIREGRCDRCRFLSLWGLPAPLLLLNGVWTARGTASGGFPIFRRTFVFLPPEEKEEEATRGNTSSSSSSARIPESTLYVYHSHPEGAWVIDDNLNVTDGAFLSVRSASAFPPSGYWAFHPRELQRGPEGRVEYDPPDSRFGGGEPEGGTGGQSGGMGGDDALNRQGTGGGGVSLDVFAELWCSDSNPCRVNGEEEEKEAGTDGGPRAEDVTRIPASEWLTALDVQSRTRRPICLGIPSASFASSSREEGEEKEEVRSQTSIEDETVDGGRVLRCPPGYEKAAGPTASSGPEGAGGDEEEEGGLICVDIDECLTGVCGQSARCVNLPGAFECDCPAGTVHRVNGRSCVPIPQEAGVRLYLQRENENGGEDEGGAGGGDAAGGGMGGKSFGGVLQLYHTRAGGWLDVCAEGVDLAAADVACRQAGFVTAAEIIVAGRDEVEARVRERLQARGLMPSNAASEDPEEGQASGGMMGREQSHASSVHHAGVSGRGFGVQAPSAILRKGICVGTERSLSECTRRHTGDIAPRSLSLLVRVAECPAERVSGVICRPLTESDFSEFFYTLDVITGGGEGEGEGEGEAENPPGSPSGPPEEGGEGTGESNSTAAPPPMELLPMERVAELLVVMDPFTVLTDSAVALRSTLLDLASFQYVGSMYRFRPGSLCAALEGRRVFVHPAARYRRALWRRFTDEDRSGVKSFVEGGGVVVAAEDSFTMYNNVFGGRVSLPSSAISRDVIFCRQFERAAEAEDKLPPGLFSRLPQRLDKAGNVVVVERESLPSHGVPLYVCGGAVAVFAIPEGRGWAVGVGWGFVTIPEEEGPRTFSPSPEPSAASSANGTAGGGGGRGEGEEVGGSVSADPWTSLFGSLVFSLTAPSSPSPSPTASTNSTVVGEGAGEGGTPVSPSVSPGKVGQGDGDTPEKSRGDEEKGEDGQIAEKAKDWCFDGELTGDEVGVDCGGSCAPCVCELGRVLPSWASFFLGETGTARLVEEEARGDAFRQIASAVFVQRRGVGGEVVGAGSVPESLASILGLSLSVRGSADVGRGEEEEGKEEQVSSLTYTNASSHSEEVSMQHSVGGGGNSSFFSSPSPPVLLRDRLPVLHEGDLVIYDPDLFCQAELKAQQRVSVPSQVTAVGEERPPYSSNETTTANRSRTREEGVSESSPTRCEDPLPPPSRLELWPPEAAVRRCLPWGGFSSYTPACLDQPAEGELRFDLGTSPLGGRVRLFRGGAWGTVCSEAMGWAEGAVACGSRGLGAPVHVDALSRERQGLERFSFSLSFSGQTTVVAVEPSSSPSASLNGSGVPLFVETMGREQTGDSEGEGEVPLIPIWARPDCVGDERNFEECATREWRSSSTSSSSTASAPASVSQEEEGRGGGTSSSSCDAKREWKGKEESGRTNKAEWLTQESGSLCLYPLESGAVYCAAPVSSSPSSSSAAPARSPPSPSLPFPSDAPRGAAEREEKEKERHQRKTDLPPPPYGVAEIPDWPSLLAAALPPIR